MLYSKGWKLALTTTSKSILDVRYTVYRLSVTPENIVVHKRQCCGCGMFIPDPRTATKERGEKKVAVIPYLEP
jgi:hypothetical protein